MENETINKTQDMKSEMEIEDTTLEEKIAPDQKVETGLEEQIAPDQQVETDLEEQIDPDQLVETDDGSAGNFMEMYEESLKSIQEGEVVKGEIVQLDKEYVLVDIGYKSEGQIPIREFVDADGNVTAKVGDQIEVLLERREDDEGTITLSKEKAAKIKIWDQVRDIYDNDGTMKGKIVSRVKGGLSVDIGLQAFLPGSQVDLRPVRDMDSMVGTEYEFKIVKYNKRRGNIVLSRRAILEAERSKLREETLKILEEGAVLEGTVKNITDYGVFVDLGGIDGLVHITDMSWGRVGHPSELHQITDQINVKVLSFDKERERVSLGIKQLAPDPWSNADGKYPIGTRIEGRVVSLTDYGAFVEVEEGVEGLIHVSEMSWTRKIRHPSQILTVADNVEAMVLNIDVNRKRISLGLKQVEPNPWDVIAEKYPVGTTIQGKIKNTTDFGVFIGIDEGIDGLVHISDISWTKRIKHPSEVYKKGQEVQAVVLNIDKDHERFSLGIKQLAKDPWSEIPVKYKPGTRVTGTVTNVTDFGLFVELEEGIEGLVHISEINRDKRGNPLARFQVDDVIQAKVINVSQSDKKIALSIRKLEESSEKEIYRSYLDGRKEATSNLGEILREEMMNLQRQSDPGETNDFSPDDGLSSQDMETPPSDTAEDEPGPVVEEPAAIDEPVSSQDTETPPSDTAEDEPEPVVEEPAVIEEALSAEEDAPPKSDESVDAEPEDGDAKKTDEAPSGFES